MISGKQLHGLRVLDVNGREIGSVQDMVADRNSGAMRGFIITCLGLISHTAFVPAESVLRLDLSGMVISGKDALRRLPRNQRDLHDLHLGELTSAKGHVTDILLDSSRITAAELSQGFVADIRSGRQIFPWEEL